MKIEPLIFNDINSINELQPEDWEDIIPKINFYIGSNFCFPIKAIAENKIIGIGATIIHNDTAWLAHIIVHKEKRGKGIGKLITGKLIEIANSHKCQTIHLIATDLGALVYEKVGFQSETEYYFFKDLKIENSINNFEKIHKYKNEDKDTISIMDKVISKEDRICEIENHLENGFVYRDTKKVEGFYLPTLGEGLIIANNSSAGIELLKFHLRINTKVALPKDNLIGVSFLYSNGFKEFRKAKRMTLGKRTNVRFENIYNRIAGNIG